PSAYGHKINNIIALAAAYETLGNFKDRTTGTFPVLNNGTYKGMPAKTTGLGYSSANSAQGGWTAPGGNNGSYGVSSVDMSHRPCYGYWSYARSGRPELHDLLLETGLAPFLYISTYRNPTLPNPGATCVLNYVLQFRGHAWANRDLQYAAGICAKSHPDGSQVWNYLDDVAEGVLKWDITWQENALGTCAKDRGYFTKASLAGGPSFTFPNSWQRGYYVSSLCAGASVRESTAAKTMLRKIGTWDSYEMANFNGSYTAYAYQEHGGTGPTANIDWTSMITSDAGWAIHS